MRHPRTTVATLAVAAAALLAGPALAAGPQERRPTDPGDAAGLDARGDAVYRTSDVRRHCLPAGKVCVHYVTSTKDAVPTADDGPAPAGVLDFPGAANGIPDIVETAAEAGERSWQVEVADLGWAAPPSDAPRGGDDRLDMYLKDIEDNGYANTDAGQTTTNQSGYLVLDNDYVGGDPGEHVDVLRGTVAHELNHVLQLGTASELGGESWLLESAAMWMETRVYPDLDQWTAYVRTVAASPDVPLTTHEWTDGRGKEQTRGYGNAMFNHFVSKQWGDGVIRDVFAGNAARTTGQVEVASDAYEAALARVGAPGGDLPRGRMAAAFLRYAAATAEWSVDDRAFGRTITDRIAAAGIDVVREAVLEVDDAREVTLDHASYELFDIPPGPYDVTVTVADAESAPNWGIAVVERGPGHMLSTSYAQAGRGEESLTIPVRRVDATGMTLVVANADFQVDDATYDPCLETPWAHDELELEVTLADATRRRAVRAPARRAVPAAPRRAGAGTPLAVCDAPVPPVTGGGVVAGPPPAPVTSGGPAGPPPAQGQPVRSAPSLSALGAGLQAALAGVRKQLAALRLRRLGTAVPVTLTLPEAGTATITWSVSAADARRLGLAPRGRRPVVVATGTARGARGQAVRVAVKPTAKARRGLRRSRRAVPITLGVRFVGGAATAKAPATATTTSTLRR